MDNALVVISQFLSAKEAASAHEVYDAHLFPTTDQDYSMEQLIDALAEQQDYNNKSHYYSFAIWDGGHSSDHHIGTSALYVEYENAYATQAENHIAQMGISHFTIPAQAGRKKVTGFAFPLENPMDYSQAMRSISLIVESIAVGGVVEYSFLPTYFFRLQKGAQCEFHYQDRMLWGQTHNEGLSKVYTNVSTWVA